MIEESNVLSDWLPKVSDIPRTFPSSKRCLYNMLMTLESSCPEINLVTLDTYILLLFTFPHIE